MERCSISCLYCELSTRYLFRPSCRVAMQSALLEPVTDGTVSERAFIRRSQFEVRMDILRAAADCPIGPTRLMYRANLAWIALQGHLKTLIEKGLLKMVVGEERSRYELTPKGFTTLDVYSNLLEVLSEQAVESRVW